MSIQTFTVDTSSIEELIKLKNIINSRLGNLRKEQGVSNSLNEQKRELLEHCFNIMNSDISSIYANKGLDTSKNYYVYAHLDTSKMIKGNVNAKTTFAATLGMKHFPFYIGKGTGNRCYELNRNETHRKVKQFLTRLDKEIEVVKLLENVDEATALAYESKLIDIFGLITHNGYLVNLDEGHESASRRQIYRDSFERLNTINKIMTV